MGSFGATCEAARFAAFWLVNSAEFAMSFQATARHFAGMLLLAFSPFAAPAATAPQQASMDAVTLALNAVVGVQVTAAEDARSADTLGREREGSGVVIGADGLILTIGYLILEADT